MSTLAGKTRLGLALLGIFAMLAGSTNCSTARKTGPSGPDFAQTINGSVGVFGLTSHTFTSDRRGVATVTLAWSTNAVDLDFYATNPGCTPTPFDCDRYASSELGGTSTELLKFGVTEGQTLRVWVNHFAGVAQNYTITIKIEG